jgi:predicted secreted protein
MPKTQGRGRIPALLLTALALLTLPVWLRPRQALAGNTITATDADNHHAMTLAVGDTLVISLTSTPGTGFGWQPAGLDDKVLRQKGTARLIHESNSMPGSAAKQVFLFVAEDSGSTALELDYVRSWEHGVPPARVFHLDVTVR